MNSIVRRENQEIRKLSTYIQTLPPGSIFYPTSEEQEIWLQSHKDFWTWLGARIYFLQFEQMGYIGQDPIELINSNAVKKLIQIQSDTFFAELQLMITGWELIKDKAEEQKRFDFDFLNPRQLFAEYCRQQSVGKLNFTFIDREADKEGQTLQEVRECYRRTTVFLRDRLKEAEEKATLEALSKHNDWLSFVIYSIWEKKLIKEFKQGKLCRAWNAYLQAFKQESRMICNKDFFKQDGCRLSLMKWCQGKPVDSAKLRPVTFYLRAG